MTFLDFPNALRDMKRYVEILRVLVRYGFGNVVQAAHMERIVDKGFSLVGLEPPPQVHELERPVRLRMVMEELGPTFIKLGQVLSTRPDLVPPSWAEEFSKLQSHCPAIPFDSIRSRLEDEFAGKLDDLFQSIEPEALAAASIAQVHRAVLKDGTGIILKIVRPGAEQVLESDFAILRTLAEFSEQYFSNLGYSPTDVVAEFKRSVDRELDLVHEGKSTERFRTMFADDPGIIFPEVYWQVTTKSVLGVEEIKGTLLSELDPESLSQDQRRAYVTNGARAVFRQCLEEGFFHADPHPGNLFALSNGRIAFIDCGMTGQVDAETLQHLGNLVAGVASGDVDRVVTVVAGLADARQDMIEDRAFKADVRDFVAHFEHTPLGSLNMGSLLQEFFSKLRAHHLRCPADLVLLIKALTTIESVGKDLDPSFDMVKFVQPYIRRLVSRNYSFPSLKRRADRAAVEYLELFERLPGNVNQLLRSLRRGELGVSLEHRGLNRLTQTVEHASRNISFALVVSALLISSSILVLADRGRESTTLSTVGMLGFATACILLVIRLLQNRRFK